MSDIEKFGEYWNYDPQKLFSEQPSRHIYAESSEHPDRYAEYWDSSRYIEDLQRHLAGKVLVDLGGGQDGETALLSVLEKHNIPVDWYVNVDVYNGHASYGQQSAEKYDSETAVSQICADLLDAIQRIPTNAKGVAIALNGIDGFVIKSREYHRQLAEEIDRVVAPGNVVLTKGSEDASDHWDESSYMYNLRRAPGYEDAMATFEPVLWVKE